MNENGNQPDMEVMLGQMKILHAQKLAEIERLNAELKVLRTAANRIQSMLRLGGAEEPKPARKGAPRMRKDTLNNLLTAIQAVETPAIEDVPLSFTAGMMVEATGHAGSVVRRGLEALREQGVIRYAGSRIGSSGRAAQVYAPVNP